jgi:hypothetical protein
MTNVIMLILPKAYNERTTTRRKYCYKPKWGKL